MARHSLTPLSPLGNQDLPETLVFLLGLLGVGFEDKITAGAQISQIITPGKVLTWQKNFRMSG